ncbi:hypothetical protein AVEN_151943-1 [Araneus ventricosus]|uniref:RNase H type-1 domain-containing protein n=1 Tax=Araneus ventricosus TaxID=182803 RepID=A0A4Y2GTX9_ARAVE|nr:hypothetical protein AVEN_151943-1 [Araneus ventricosus]
MITWLLSDRIWILSDSRSSIQHLKDWNNVGDRTGISILKLLRHIGVDHEVHLQWIPSHVDIYGNEVADDLAKQGKAEPLCSGLRKVWSSECVPRAHPLLSSPI